MTLQRRENQLSAWGPLDGEAGGELGGRVIQKDKGKRVSRERGGFSVKRYGRRERNIPCSFYESCRVQEKAACVVNLTRVERPKSTSEDDGMMTLVASSMHRVAWLIFHLYSTPEASKMLSSVQMAQNASNDRT